MRGGRVRRCVNNNSLTFNQNWAEYASDLYHKNPTSKAKKKRRKKKLRSSRSENEPKHNSPAFLYLELECGAVLEVWGFGEDTVPVPTWRFRFTRRDATLPTTLLNSNFNKINNTRSGFLQFSLSILIPFHSLPLIIVRFQANDDSKGTLLSLLSVRGTYFFTLPSKFGYGISLISINFYLDPIHLLFMR